MNTLLRTFIVVASAILVACGGGGSGGGEPTGPSAKLRIYPPVESISLPVGASGSAGVEVRGGRGPYTVTTSDGAVQVGLSEDNFLYVAGTKAGTSEVVIYDTSLPVQTVKVSVTAQVVPISSNIGTAINLAPGQSQQVTIRGGVGPYGVTTTDASVATASVSDSSVVITAQPKSGIATISVVDSLGSTFSIQVTVAISTMSVSPATITGPAGTSSSISIRGGIAPYAVSSTNSAVASASVSGSSVSVNLLSLGTASISVSDSTGQSIIVSVTVNSDTLRVAPANQEVPEKGNASLTYLISGGTAPYTPLISVADSAFATVTVVGSTLTVGAPGANRCVTADRVVPIDIYDSKLIKQTVTMTIKDGGAAITCP
ncbi:hypothetical protein [Acidovorax sp. LjRoot117]|uniref:hypothetical protein n=1 Tax=Acidovorax sp. LjRoot117 TaxID=3342255 RepID=UPI003ECE7427